MKEELRQNKFGSGSTVCSEASTAVGKGASGTFGRPPPGIAARYSDMFVPRKWNSHVGSLTSGLQ